ncbi:MAG: hypothetical protein V4449_00090 [Patescibacteria group bacterium]
MFKDVVQLCSSIPRLKILKFFLCQPESRATAIVVANTTGVSKEVTARELRALGKYGVLNYRKQGKKIFWSVNSAHPFTVPMSVFLEATTQPNDALITSSFRGVSGITLLVVAGVLTGEERGLIDILIVTKKPNDQKIAVAVRAVERLSALPLRYAVLEKGDYAERLEARDRMLRDVLEFKHRTIIDRR